MSCLSTFKKSLSCKYFQDVSLSLAIILPRVFKNGSDCWKHTYGVVLQAVCSMLINELTEKSNTTEILIWNFHVGYQHKEAKLRKKMWQDMHTWYSNLLIWNKRVFKKCLSQGPQFILQTLKIHKHMQMNCPPQACLTFNNVWYSSKMLRKNRKLTSHHGDDICLSPQI